MGPKPKVEGEDLSIEQFYKQYKRNCTALEITICKIIKEKYDQEYLEEGQPIQKFNLWEQIGW